MNTYMKNITFAFMAFMSISAALHGAEVERKETIAQLRQKHAEELNFINAINGRMIKPEDVEQVEAMVTKTEEEIAAGTKLKNEKTEAAHAIRKIFYNEQNLPKKVMRAKAQKIIDTGLLDEEELWFVLSNFIHFPNPTAVDLLLNYVSNKELLLVQSIRSCKESTDIVKLILKYNPKRDVLTGDGNSPLVTAFIRSEGRSINDIDIEIVELLLSAGYTEIIYARKPYKNITDFITEYRALPIAEHNKKKISDERAQQVIDLFEKYTAKKAAAQKATEKKSN